MVLMDLQMPVMDGLTATRLIRDIDRFAEMPVIAMTAHTMTHERNKCAEVGMNDHLGKPFAENAFYRLLAKWIPPHKQVQRAPMTPRETTEANIPSIRGIDTRVGLGLLQGDVARYRFWLKAFVNEAPPAVLRLKAALAAGNNEQASAEAHTLKGRMGLLAMKPLHAIASALEMAIDRGEPAHTLVTDLEQGVAAMCAELVAGLGAPDTSTEIPTPYGEIPAGPTPPAIEHLLSALRAGDGDCDKLLLACMDALADTPWMPRLRKAQDLSNHFNYAAAFEVLTGKPLGKKQGYDQ
jgi:CheY-like chemotaxis protein